MSSNSENRPNDEAPRDDLTALFTTLESKASTTDASSKSDLLDSADDEMALLRGLLMDGYESYIDTLNSQVTDVQKEMVDVQGKLDAMDDRLDDKEALLQTINPVIASSIREKIKDSRSEMIEALSPIMADTIREKIRDSRSEMIDALSPIMADTIRENINDSKDEMVEALYPLVGQLVQRSVREAINSLTSRIDQQIQTRLSFRTLTRTLRARISGVSPAELAIRESLPFNATALFLIHRETGLLLAYVDDAVLELSPDWAVDQELHMELPAPDLDAIDDHTDTLNASDDNQFSRHYDSDLISGMLTAIRSFVDEAFGKGDDGSLDQVDYGSQKILIETGQHAYMAVVTEGTAPYEYRGKMRDCIMGIHREFMPILQDYSGDASPFESSESQLQALLTESDGTPPLTDQAQSQTLSSEISEVQQKTRLAQNSTLLNPLSILLVINVIVILLWWLLG